MSSKTTSPDAIARAKALAETSLLSWRDIALETGVPASTIGAHARREKWQRPDARAPMHAMPARLWDAANQHLASIEAQLKTGATTTALRDLAVLIKMIGDLLALNAEVAAQPQPAREKSDADIRDAIWQNIQRLRALDGGTQGKSHESALSGNP